MWYTIHFCYLLKNTFTRLSIISCAVFAQGINPLSLIKGSINTFFITFINIKVFISEDLLEILTTIHSHRKTGFLVFLSMIIQQYPIFRTPNQIILVHAFFKSQCRIVNLGLVDPSTLPMLNQSALLVFMFSLTLIIFFTMIIIISKPFF